MRHKHADLIKEWAETGRQVQLRIPKSPHDATWYIPKFFDCKDNKPEWDENYEYRFKPEIIRYRRYLYEMASGKTELRIIQEQDSDSYFADPAHMHKSQYFVRWIDTEWQEVEV